MLSLYVEVRIFSCFGSQLEMSYSLSIFPHKTGRFWKTLCAQQHPLNTKGFSDVHSRSINIMDVKLTSNQRPLFTFEVKLISYCGRQNDVKTTLFANLVKRKTNYIRTFPRDAKFINFVFVCLLFFYKKNTQKTMPLNYCLLIFNRDLSQSYEKPQSNMHYKKKARFKFQFENNKAARFLFHWESRVDLKWVVGTNWELWWDFIRNLLN